MSRLLGDTTSCMSPRFTMYIHVILYNLTLAAGEQVGEIKAT